jgi:excisionase family DNA binding protein
MPRSARTEKKVIPIRTHAPTPVPELESPAPQPIAANKLLLTPQQAADALSINRSTLYALLMREKIPSILIGRARRIPVQVLEEWIAGKLIA